MRTLVLALAGLSVVFPAAAWAADPPQHAERVASHDAQAAAPYERIGRFIYAFHRTGLSIESLTSDELAKNAPPALSSRARNLAVRFESILKTPESVPDSELQATLQEAAQVSAALKQWRQGGLQESRSPAAHE